MYFIFFFCLIWFIIYPFLDCDLKLKNRKVRSFMLCDEITVERDGTKIFRNCTESM